MPSDRKAIIKKNEESKREQTTCQNNSVGLVTYNHPNFVFH